MRCDHARPSPLGTVVRWSFVTHGGRERRWYEVCRCCGRTLNAGRQELSKEAHGQWTTRR